MSRLASSPKSCCEERHPGKQWISLDTIIRTYNHNYKCLHTHIIAWHWKWYDCRMCVHVCSSCGSPHHPWGEWAIVLNVFWFPRPCHCNSTSPSSRSRSILAPHVELSWPHGSHLGLTLGAILASHLEPSWSASMASGKYRRTLKKPNACLTEWYPYASWLNPNTWAYKYTSIVAKLHEPAPSCCMGSAILKI